MKKINLQAEDDSIEINDVTFTPEMLDKLCEWYKVGPLDDSMPQVFYEWLQEAQQYFARYIGNHYGEEDADIGNLVHLMGNMTFMMDDMKAIIPKKKEPLTPKGELD